MSRDGAGFVDEHSAGDRLPRAVVRGRRRRRRRSASCPCPPIPTCSASALRTPEIVEVKSPGGQTLYGALLKPRHIEPGSATRRW